MKDRVSLTLKAEIYIVEAMEKFVRENTELTYIEWILIFSRLLNRLAVEVTREYDHET